MDPRQWTQGNGPEAERGPWQRSGPERKRTALKENGAGQQDQIARQHTSEASIHMTPPPFNRINLTLHAQKIRVTGQT